MTKTGKTSKTLIAVIAALCMAASLALFGCGSSSSDTSSTDTSSGTSASTSSDDSSADSSSASSDSSSSSTLSIDDAVAQMTECYAGQCEDGTYIYYGGGTSGSLAILAYLNTSTGTSASFVGPVTNNDDGTVTVTDNTSGLAINFSATSNGDGTLTIDMGSEIGTAVVSAVSNSDLATALTSIASSTTAVQ